MHHYLLTTYNHAHYIEATLASIRALYPDAAQFQQTARLWLLDDASADATLTGLHRLQASYPNLSIRRNPRNLGVGATRNRLLDWWRAAKPDESDHLLFVDGDDLLAPHSLSSRLSVLAANPGLDVVGGQLGLFFDDQPGRIIAFDSFALEPDILAIANLFECHFYIGNALFRAAVFLDPQRRFAEIPSSEDWLFFTTQNLRMRHIPQITLHYRQHAHNLSSHGLDARQSFHLRRQVRALSLLRLGYAPTVADCHLLDRIGYLSLRMHWHQGRLCHKPGLRLPWFLTLKEQTDLPRAWPRIRRELQQLCTRICAHNRKQPHFDPALLQRYCAGLLACAEIEIDGAVTAYSEQSIST